MRCLKWLFVAATFWSVAFAQTDFGIPDVLPKEYTFIANSAPPALGAMIFNIDIIDTANPRHGNPVLPITSNQVWVSTDNQASWAGLPLSLDGSVDYTSTYFRNYTLPISSGTMYYYFQTATDSTFTSQSPVNTAETFPPPNNLIANIHDDPASDIPTITIGSNTFTWSNTDLRNFKMGHSDDRVYIQLTTNGGLDTAHTNITQRTCSIIWTQKVTAYHLYGVPIINPNAPYPDSVFFAVLYGGVNFTFIGIGIRITPGVYKITVPGDGATISDYLDAYTKISDASTFGVNASGNTVNMWFDFDILTADPDFGPMAADSGFVTGAGLVTLIPMYKACSSLLPDTFEYSVTDFSKNTGFYLTTPRDVVNVNANFNLSAGTLTTLGDSMEISVTYTDADNNLPTLRRAKVGGCFAGNYTMHAADHKYSDGSVFKVRIPRANSKKVPVQFDFDDGMYSYSSAWDSLNTGISNFSFDIDGAETVMVTLAALDCKDTVIIAAIDSMRLRNGGTEIIDFGIQVVSITATGKTFYAGSAPGTDTFTVRAIFNETAAPPASSTFDGAHNTLSSTTLWANGTNFQGGGYNILPQCYNGSVTALTQNSDKLWLKIIAPNYVRDAPGDMNVTIKLIVRSRIHTS